MLIFFLELVVCLLEVLDRYFSAAEYLSFFCINYLCQFLPGRPFFLEVVDEWHDRTDNVFKRGGLERWRVLAGFSHFSDILRFLCVSVVELYCDERYVVVVSIGVICPAVLQGLNLVSVVRLDTMLYLVFDFEYLQHL